MRVICDICDSEYDSAYRFCPHCGTANPLWKQEEIPKDTHTQECPECGRVLHEDAPYCPYCGYGKRSGAGKAVLIVIGVILLIIGAYYAFTGGFLMGYGR